MDKRTILALVLTMALVFVFQTYFTPKPAPAPAKSTEAAQGKSKGTESSIKAKEVTPGNAAVAGAASSEKKTTKTITAETPLLKVSLTDLGGAVSSVALKKYKSTVKGDKSKELVEDIKPFLYIPAVSQTVGDKSINDSVIFTADRDSVIVTDKPQTIVFTGLMENGVQIKKSYTFHPDSYAVDFSLETTDNRNMYCNFALIGDKKESSYIFKGPFVFTANSLEQIDKLKEPIFYKTNYTYAGFDDGYFAFIWIPKPESKPALTVLKNEAGTPVVQLDLSGKGTAGRLYFGPKESNTLQGLNVKAEKVIDFGWFDIIAKPLVMGLNFSNKVTHNYGIDIIFLTILIKLLFYPLSVKSYKSMKKMQGVQPKMAKLKEQLGNNKEELNKRMMELYRSEGINPASGCLPMIIQIPFFFAFYKGLYGAIELRHAPFFAWINDLSAPEDLYSFVVAGYTIPIRILPLIMGVTQLIQQKMTPTSADPMQEKMMLFMPIVFTFMFWGFPSGLVLYWLVNNVVSIGQQYYINKTAK